MLPARADVAHVVVAEDERVGQRVRGLRRAHRLQKGDVRVRRLPLLGRHGLARVRVRDGRQHLGDHRVGVHGAGVNNRRRLGRRPRNGGGRRGLRRHGGGPRGPRGGRRGVPGDVERVRHRLADGLLGRGARADGDAPGRRRLRRGATPDRCEATSGRGDGGRATRGAGRDARRLARGERECGAGERRHLRDDRSRVRGARRYDSATPRLRNDTWQRCTRINVVVRLPLRFGRTGRKTASFFET